MLEDWEEADQFLLQAEEIYAEANRLTSRNDERAQSSLREVRHDMDQLRLGMDEDALAELEESEEEDVEMENDEQEEQKWRIQIMFQRLNVILVRVSMSSPESKLRMQI